MSRLDECAISVGRRRKRCKQRVSALGQQNSFKLYLVVGLYFLLQSSRLWSSEIAQSTFPTADNQFRDAAQHLRFSSPYTISSNIRDRNLISMLGNSKNWKGLRKEFSASFDPILKVPSTYLNFSSTKMQCSFTATLTTLIHNNLSARLVAALQPVGAPRCQYVSHFVIMTDTMTVLHLWTFFLHEFLHYCGFLTNLTWCGRIFSSLKT